MAQIACKTLPCQHFPSASRRSAHLRSSNPEQFPVQHCLPTLPCQLIGSSGQRCAVVAQSAAPGVGQPTPPQADLAKVADTLKGCRTVLKELQGLDFSKLEVQLYFAQAIKTPKGFNAQGADMKRASAVLEQVIKVDSEGDPLPASSFTDVAGLTLVQAVLSELWRWRRRGGGMNTEDVIRPHQLALADIQNLDLKPVEDIDRTTSSLLDSLNISDAEKKEMSGGMQKLAIGAFQGAVWGSLVFGIASFVLFNFARGG